MVYELFFKGHRRDITLELFQDYFGSLMHYCVDDDTAYYSNEDTGVYFVFHYLHKGKKHKSKDIYRISLNVDYCVPAFFIIEALYEVDAIVNNMGTDIYDPQPDGVGDSGYDPDIMFESWISQNEEAIKKWAVESAQNGDDDEPVVAPYDWLHRVWSWNYNKIRIQKKLGSNIYVPAIKFLTDQEMVKVGIIWPYGRAIAMPKVDLVAINKDSDNSDNKEYYVVDYSEISGFVEKYTSYFEGDACIMKYESIPDDIKLFISRLNYSGEYKFIEVDEILETEIVQDALFPEGVF